jgi:hypothetical protein
MITSVAQLLQRHSEQRARNVALARWRIDCARYRGRLLTGKRRHYCPTALWLPVDETCIESRECTCELTEFERLPQRPPEPSMGETVGWALILIMVALAVVITVIQWHHLRDG